MFISLLSRGNLFQNVRPETQKPASWTKMSSNVCLMCVCLNEGYKCMGLTTLETRFLRADLIEVFKILRRFENLDPDRFFQVVGDGVRRGHSFKLFKKRYRLDVGKFKFASRVFEEWNRLGDGIVSAGTVNVFKMRHDHHLRNVRGIYTYLLFSPADGHP